MRILSCLLCLSFLWLTACGPGEPAPRETGEAARTVATADVFDNSAGGLSDYWYQGEAEVTRYELQQNRYGDVHAGEAVMIFVTEDFLTDKQVKNDRYQNPNSVLILKNNMIRKFPTGIYDYSMMTSVFTPVETSKNPMTLKVTTSSQEWCGHTFMQVNWEEDGYRTTLHSYFEKEADQVTKAPHAILEDELYNRIRIHPDGLPTGDLTILPSTMYVRLRHHPFEPVQAQATLHNYEGTDFTGEQLQAYRLVFPDHDRTLEIVFEKEAPYRIAGWTDRYPSMFDGQMRTTIARATKTIMTAYWQQNSREDQHLRRKLGLTGIRAGEE